MPLLQPEEVHATVGAFITISRTKFKEKWTLCSRNKMPADCIFFPINTKQTFFHFTQLCWIPSWMSFLSSTINHLTEGRKGVWVGNELVGERNRWGNTQLQLCEGLHQRQWFLSTPFHWTAAAENPAMDPGDNTYLSTVGSPPAQFVLATQFGRLKPEKAQLGVSVFKLWNVYLVLERERCVPGRRWAHLGTAQSFLSCIM